MRTSVSPNPKVLPQSHVQAGMRYPEVGEVIESCAHGENGSDYSPYEVVALSPEGDPVIDPGDGTRSVLRDPHEWSWPEGGRLVRAARAVRRALSRLRARTVDALQATPVDTGPHDRHYHESLADDEARDPLRYFKT